MESATEGIPSGTEVIESGAECGLARGLSTNAYWTVAAYPSSLV
jgi:hypothetical protein